MKLQSVENHNFESHLPEERIAFKIQSSARLFNILSSGIYEDKILAVIRELSCNAYDAHIAAGKRDVPFYIKLPNYFDATFSITDVGTGIDPTKIGDIFWTYGSSTKSDSNEFIGALGLGSKSPFAYTKSSFAVKNRYKGVEYHYLCFINEQGTPDGSKLAEIPTIEPDGVTIEFAVRQHDVMPFSERVVRFYSTWSSVLPIFSGQDIVIPVHEKSEEGHTWYLKKYGDNTAIALMGNVPYPINAESIPNLSNSLKLICNNSFVIKFPMGSLNFASSREGLEYNEYTCNQLLVQFELVRKEIVENFHNKVFAAKTAVEFIYKFAIEFVKFKQSFKLLTGSARDENLNYIDVLFQKSLNDTITFQGDEYLLENLVEGKFYRKDPGVSPFGLYGINVRGSSLKLTSLQKIDLTDLDDFTIDSSYFSRVSNITPVEVKCVIQGRAGKKSDYAWVLPKNKKFKSRSSAEMMARILHAQSNPLDIEASTSTSFIVVNPKNITIIVNNLGTIGNQRAAAFIQKNQKNNGMFFYVQNPDNKSNSTELLKSVTDWVGDSKLGINVSLISDLADERKKNEVESNTKELVTVPCSIWELYDSNSKTPCLIYKSGFGRTVNIHNKTTFKLSDLKAEDKVYYTTRLRNKDVVEPTVDNDDFPFCLGQYDILKFINKEKLYESLIHPIHNNLTVLNLTESQVNVLKKRGVNLVTVLDTLTPVVIALAEKEKIYTKYYEYRSLYLNSEYDLVKNYQYISKEIKKLISKESLLHEIFEFNVQKNIADLDFDKNYIRIKLMNFFIKNPEVYNTFTEKQWNFKKIIDRYPMLHICISHRDNINTLELQQHYANYINECDDKFVDKAV